jgi:hypothetical protein
VLVTKLTRSALAFRREQRKLLAAGYRRCETDWEIHRGGKSFGAREDGIEMKWRIVDAKVSHCGMYVYTKLGLVPDTK